MFDSDSEDELSNLSDDTSDENDNHNIKKSTFRKLGMYMHNLSKKYYSDSESSDDEFKREIFTNIGIYMHQLSCEKAICYKLIMKNVFKELLSYFKNYISDSESESFFYLSDDEE